MAISLLPFPQFIVSLVQFGYPLWCYFEQVKSGKTVSHLEYVQWTIYWVICVLWMFIESTFLWMLIDYLPFFLELKLAFFLWLVHPTYKGAAYLWFAKLQAVHKKLDDTHYAKIMGYLSTPLKLPEAAKAQEVTTSNKEEAVNELLTKK